MPILCLLYLMEQRCLSSTLLQIEGMKSVFICTSPRSGSYHLADLLHLSGLPFAEEIFIPFHENALRQNYKLLDVDDKIEFYKRLVEKHAEEGVFIAKLMPDQLKRVLGTIGHASGKPADLQEFSSIFPDPKFIHLERSDLLAQAISLTKPRQTGQWIKTSDSDERYSIQPYYSYIEIAYSKNRLRRMNQFWDEWFAGMGIEPLRMFYENLVKDPSAELAGLFEFIGEGHCQRPLPEDPRFKKTASSVNRSWYMKFTQQEKEATENWSPAERPDIGNFRLKKVALLDEYEKQQRPRLEIEIETSLPETNLIGDPNGLRWLTVNILIEHEEEQLSLLSHFEVPPQEPTGNCYKLAPILYLPLPPTPVFEGYYKIHINLAWELKYAEYIAAHPHFSGRFRIKPLEAQRKCREFFGNVKMSKDGWKELDWFGFILDEHFPWIFHSEHNWLYFETSRKDPEYHVFDHAIGWIGIDPEKYPEIRLLETNESLRYMGRTADLRHFTNLTTRENLTFPPNDKSYNDPS